MAILEEAAWESGPTIREVAERLAALGIRTNQETVAPDRLTLEELRAQLARLGFETPAEAAEMIREDRDTR